MKFKIGDIIYERMLTKVKMKIIGIESDKYEIAYEDDEPGFRRYISMDFIDDICELDMIRKKKEDFTKELKIITDKE